MIPNTVWVSETDCWIHVNCCGVSISMTTLSVLHLVINNFTLLRRRSLQ